MYVVYDLMRRRDGLYFCMVLTLYIRMSHSSSVSLRSFFLEYLLSAVVWQDNVLCCRKRELVGREESTYLVDGYTCRNEKSGVLAWGMFICVRP